MKAIRSSRIWPIIAVIGFLHSLTVKGHRLEISTDSVVLLEGHSTTFTVTLIGGTNTSLAVQFIAEHNTIISVTPDVAQFPPTQQNVSQTIVLYGKGAGRSLVTSTVYENRQNITSDAPFLRATVEKVAFLDRVSFVIGWIYFAAWSISFYPQVYENFKRKSVVGLNFDFVTLNIVGFVMYTLFNCGLYFVDTVKAEYHTVYPRGIIPVKLNDVMFGVHACVLCLITITQCFIYERDQQRVSRFAKTFIAVIFVVVAVTFCVAFVRTILWYDFLKVCSYIKLTITLVKYVPQAYMNYTRKSTVGWSLGNVLLDFIGGMFSMLQMILDAYNYDDWASLFGDLTKFGLGLFSVLFDVFFIAQHIRYSSSSTEMKRLDSFNSV